MITLQFLISMVVQLLINLIYTILALFVGLIALKAIDKHVLKKIDIEEEIRKGNVSVAIFASTMLLFVAIIVAVGLKG